MGRSKWKAPYTNLKDFNLSKKQSKVVTISRKSSIIPQFLGTIFNVYNGKNYIELTVTEDMVGHKFGEFAFTRAKFIFKKKRK